MKNTAIFLAKTWAQTQDVVYHCFSLPPDECKEYLINNYPQMQGMRNNINLRRLGELPFDTSGITTEIAAALDDQPKETK